MHKRDMPINFNFRDAEERIYKWWEEHRYFKPEAAGANAEPYVISMPPPNVTGVLHVGHALFTALQDLMIRYERMRGKAALWLPGTDHAGIATQLQVEKQLQLEGTSRLEIGREAFLARTWRWTEEKGGTIISQLRRMGASCDWDRLRFTLDEGLSEAVQEVFVRLWEQGLIYRGPRLVNWSPGLQTAVSDLEVEREEEDGKLYIFQYPVDGGEFIPVATTRPETILGDTAVAVHPQDERYQRFIGRRAFVPIIQREIPIIADEYVDPTFGTGALKVTPAHDFNDYAIGKKHHLPMINIMNRDATLNENAGPYAGMDRYAARETLWRDMTEVGLALRVETRRMVVPRSQRGGEVIEPLLSDQWFVRMQPLAEKALDAVRSGHIRIVPDRFEKVYYHWLENIEDWCVSRQLWWGHRIPAWYREKDGDPYGEIYVGRTAPEGDGWCPELDVLDTWFSSALWPFSTLGWPHDTEDFRRFYPTSMMETGHDILFFWVARMIMMGLWFTDQPPFHTVYLHGLIRDKFGRKISKTLGNVIDPIDIITQYGADPLRFTLVTSGTPGNDVNLDIDRVEYNFRFINKVWNITRLVNMNLDSSLEPGLPPYETLDVPSRWIVSRVNRLVASVQHLFDIYQYGEAGNQILSFMWDEFAPWYLEAAKHPLYNGTYEEKVNTQRVMVYVLDICLRLLHPFMPFMTEEAWSYIPHQGEALIMASWPAAQTQYIDDRAEADFHLFMELIRDVRNIRKTYNVDPAKRIKALMAASDERRALLERYSYLFARLCNVTEVRFVTAQEAPSDAAAAVVGDVTLYLPVEGLLDVRAECDRLMKERANALDQISRISAKLSNESFTAKAPPQVVARERERLAEFEASLSQIEERLRTLCYSSDD